MANGQNSKNKAAGQKKSSKKRNSGANRYTAGEILALISAEPGPVPWSTLTHLAGADKPKTITQLRQMLKGLLRSGELQRNRHGDYQLPESGAPRSAVVQLRGRMMVVDDLPIDDAGRMNLRAGDEVEYRVSDGHAQVIQVTRLSEALFTGIFSKQGRDQFVNGLGQDRGRVKILQPAKKARDGDTVQVTITARDERGLSGNVTHILVSENVLDQAIQTAVTGSGIPFEWPAEVT